MPCDRCTARVHAPLFQIFNHAAMGVERLVQKILCTARQKLRNQVTNDIGQGGSPPRSMIASWKASSFSALRVRSSSS